MLRMMMTGTDDASKKAGERRWDMRLGQRWSGPLQVKLTVKLTVNGHQWPHMERNLL